MVDGIAPGALSGRGGAPAAIELRDISKVYGPTVALNSISLRIEEGETRGIIGRNGAGKSTLVGLVTGLQPATAGEILLHGEEAPLLRDHHRWRSLVGMVHQHSTLQEGLSVAENLFVGELPRSRLGLVDWHSLRRTARTVLGEWELEISESASAGRLTLAERQLVEIAREVSRGAGIVIFDEPTSRLASREADRLYEHICRLKGEGITIIYISHHLAEVMDVCDAVTVLRDGRHVVTRRVVDTDPDQLVGDMVGDDERIPVPAARSAARATGAPVALRVDRLAAPGLNPLSFTIRAGEAVGVAGLVGSGKEVLVELLAGRVAKTVGQVEVDGNRVPRSGIAAAIEAGIATVPGDRHRDGQVPGLGIGENMTMSITRELALAGGVLSPARQRRAARELMDEVGMVASSPAQPARSLSGGNQQKGVIARALATEPSVLVLVEPTSGVDIASKAAILELIAERRERGMAVLLVSEELEEYELCDQVLVLFDGSVNASFETPTTEAALLSSIEGIGITS